MGREGVSNFYWLKPIHVPSCVLCVPGPRYLFRTTRSPGRHRADWPLHLLISLWGAHETRTRRRHGLSLWNIPTVSYPLLTVQTGPRLRWPRVVSRLPTPGASHAAAGTRGCAPLASRHLLLQHDCFAEGAHLLAIEKYSIYKNNLLQFNWEWNLLTVAKSIQMKSNFRLPLLLNRINLDVLIQKVPFIFCNFMFHKSIRKPISSYNSIVSVLRP